MDFLINRCLIVIILIQLSLLGDAYLVDRKATGYLDKETNNEVVDNSNIDIAELKRYIHEDGKELQQEERASEEVDEEIKELVTTLIGANRMNSNGMNDMHRKHKTGWWFCPWCDGSKPIIEAADIIGCTCETGIRIKCKCPDGKVRIHNGNQQKMTLA